MESSDRTSPKSAASSTRREEHTSSRHETSTAASGTTKGVLATPPTTAKRRKKKQRQEADQRNHHHKVKKLLNPKPPTSPKPRTMSVSAVPVAESKSGLNVSVEADVAGSKGKDKAMGRAVADAVSSNSPVNDPLIQQSNRLQHEQPSHPQFKEQSRQQWQQQSQQPHGSQENAERPKTAIMKRGPAGAAEKETSEKLTRTPSGSSLLTRHQKVARRESLVRGITGKIDRIRHKLTAMSVSKQISRAMQDDRLTQLPSSNADDLELAGGPRGNQVVPIDYQDFLNASLTREATRKSSVRAVPLYSKGFPIDPHHPFRTVWTTIMLLLILFECTVTPFGIGFLPLATGPSALDYTEAIFDVMFIADLLLNFVVAIRGYDGRLVRNYKVIAANYIARGFWLDLFTSMPFSLIIVAVEAWMLGNGQTDSIVLVNVEALALVKVLRVLKIGKFLRVMRFEQSRKRTQMACGVATAHRPSYARRYILKSIIILVMGAVFTCHLIACGWGLLPKLVSEHVPRVWNIEMGLSGIDIWEECVFSVSCCASLSGRALQPLPFLQIARSKREEGVLLALAWAGLMVFICLVGL